ncbi:hypothetical protein GCM10023205_73230 [Yinghuangia aomiensis]|uniref:Uncharacterized protein n=1 Tax=Yinghuangia aomiensis TaxID=676205 RepID=A0ABP9I933_9ACTN
MTEPARLTTGARLRSQVCSTEVIVVRPPKGAVELTCGGAPMLALDAAQPGGTATPEAGLDTGTQLGKRYAIAGEDDFEVLVTKPGVGSLADGRTPLEIKAAKALPSSD